MAPADGETVEAAEGVYPTQLVAGDRTSVQQFHVEPGTAVPGHGRDHEQTGDVVHGTLTISAEGIDVFSPPRNVPDWIA